MTTIRQATLRDLPTLRLLWSHLWRAIEHGGAPITFDEADLDLLTVDLAHALRSPTFVALLALDGALGDAPQGMLVAELQTRRYGSPKQLCYITAAWIEPQYRQAKVSPFLVKGVAEWVHQFDPLVEDVEYIATPGLDGPLHWWREGLGFTAVETRYVTKIPSAESLLRVDVGQPDADTQQDTNPEEAA